MKEIPLSTPVGFIAVFNVRRELESDSATNMLLTDLDPKDNIEMSEHVYMHVLTRCNKSVFLYI